MFRFKRALLGLSALMLVAFLFAASAGFAQTGTTSVRGTVTDKSGGTVSGAKITITNSAQGLERTAETGESGEYEFLALPPGTYKLTVEKDGFRKYEQTNLRLLVNSPATANIAIEVGTAVQTVERSEERRVGKECRDR